MGDPLGPYAGQRRQPGEPPRRMGALSDVERMVIRLLVLDQPGSDAQAYLESEKQVERLARLLRRMPATVRRAMQAELVLARQKDATLEALRRIRPSIEFVRSLLEEMTRTPPPPRE